jgi:two-component system, cell cycle sensor histidine kinase and response regulator CckA
MISDYPKWLKISIVLAFLALAAGWAWFYKAQEKASRLRVEEQLVAIGKLKADEIVSWRKQRIEYSEVLAENPTISQLVARIISGQDDGAARRELLSLFESLRLHYDYDDVLLSDTAGGLVLTLNKKGEKHRAFVPHLSEAFSSGKSLLVDLHTDEAHPQPHISVIAPIFSVDSGSRSPLGAIILVCDATSFLFPLIQSWPTPNKSCETLLVRRDGDRVLFLNELRHRKGTALRLSFPLNRTEIPAVMAVLGKTGLVEGKDYRGEEVLAYIEPIAGSDWFIVSKEDSKEIFAPWRQRSLFLVLLAFFSISTVIALLMIMSQEKEKDHFRDLYAAESRLREMTQKHATTLRSIGDAVISCDTEGKVEFLNLVAEKLTGWREEEAKGRLLKEVFNIVNETTHEEVENPVTRVLKEGLIIVLANHTLLIAKDGTERAIADSGAPIMDESGKIIGVVLVFRDQTEERRLEREVEQSEVLLRSVMDRLPVGIAVNSVDPVVNFSYMNDNFPKFYRTTRETLENPDSFWETVYEDPAFREEIKKRVIADCASGDPERMHWQEIPITRSGEPIGIITARNIPVPGKKLMISVVSDMTKIKEAEKTLIESEERFRSIYNNSTIGLYRTTQDGKILMANPALVKMLGYESFEKLAERNLEKDGYEPSYERKRFIDLVEKDGEIRGLESAWKRDDGTILFVRESARAFKDKDGRLLYYEGTAEDITDRKLAEITLKESEERFRSFVENANDIVFSLTPEGNFKYISPNWTEMLGHDIKEIMGSFFGVIIHPEDVPMCKSYLDRAIMTGEKQSGIEYRIMHKNGSWRWHVTNASVVRNDDDKIISIVGIARDITERKKAETELKESEARFRSLIETAPEAIFVQSDERFVYLNPAMQELLGAGDASELLGTHMMARIAPECHDIIRNRIREQLDTGESAPLMEQEYLRLDGSRVFVEATAVPIKFEGNDGHLVFLRNITTRKLAEEQQEKLQTQLIAAQKMDSIGRLAGGMAHDFNNLLSVIIGHAELALQHADLGDKVHPDIHEILDAAGKSTELIKQLLAFARKQTISPNIMDLNKVVEKTIKMVKPLIGEDIALEWKPDRDLWRVKIDPTQIDQIIVNLCLNARDAIHDGGKIIIETQNAIIDEAYCQTHSDFKAGNYTMLGVSDNGSGMEKETSAHLFEPFFTTKEIGKGAGLGLATVYGIVKQNGGFINVYSEPDKGTTFKVYIPRHNAGIRPGEVVDRTEDILPESGSEVLLIVEDELAILKIAKKILENLGYHVLSAALPSEAIDLVGEFKGEIHLLITDVIMPEMNGKSLFEKLRLMRPGLKSLYMSGYTANVISHHGVLDKNLNFIQKPFTIKMLARKVREALGVEFGNE